MMQSNEDKTRTDQFSGFTPQAGPGFIKKNGTEKYVNETPEFK